MSTKQRKIDQRLIQVVCNLFNFFCLPLGGVQIGEITMNPASY